MRPLPMETLGAHVDGTQVHVGFLPRDTPMDWIVDPCAREYGTGHRSAFTLGYQEHVRNLHENACETPRLRDLVVYELMIHEIAGTCPEPGSGCPTGNTCGSTVSS